MFLLLLMRQLSANSKTLWAETLHWRTAWWRLCIHQDLPRLHAPLSGCDLGQRCRSSSVWSCGVRTNPASPASSPVTVSGSRSQMPTVSICDVTTKVLIWPYCTVRATYADLQCPWWLCPEVHTDVHLDYHYGFVTVYRVVGSWCSNLNWDNIPKFDHLISFRAQIYGQCSWRTLKTAAFQLPDDLINDGRGDNTNFWVSVMAVFWFGRVSCSWQSIEPGVSLLWLPQGKRLRKNGSTA